MKKTPKPQPSPEQVPEKKPSKKKKLLLLLLSTLLITAIAFTLYVNDYYKAEPIALEVLNNNSFQTEKNLTILHGDSPQGIIFYPGAKVEAIAYLPLLQKLQQEGYTCVLIEMPFNMAIFNTNAADDVFALNLDVETWYIAGHSMGGGMASSYASNNPEKVEGLLLLGAYVYGTYPPSKSLTIYGSYNDNLEEKINYTENILKISGGNHAKFGNYGIQKGDPEGDITHDEQQNITVQAIVNFTNLKA